MVMTIYEKMQHHVKLLNFTEFIPRKIEGNQQHHAAFLFLLDPQQFCLISSTAVVQPTNEIT